MVEIIVLLEIYDDTLFIELEKKAIEIMHEHHGQLLSAFDLNSSEKVRYQT